MRYNPTYLPKFLAKYLILCNNTTMQKLTNQNLHIILSERLNDTDLFLFSMH